MSYLSALEVCSRRGAIQIHVYLYLYLYIVEVGTVDGHIRWVAAKHFRVRQDDPRTITYSQ